jgi:iron-sulfur cluster assembly accessory protein
MGPLLLKTLRKEQLSMENIEQIQSDPVMPQPVEEEVPVTLTAKAAEMVRITRQQEGIDETFGLRVAVRGGGCSGFEYALDFTNEARSNDFVYEQNGLTVYVDAVSARYLQGTSIDYVLGSTGAGFKFNNPQARGSCGCGSSFAV